MAAGPRKAIPISAYNQAGGQASSPAIHSKGSTPMNAAVSGVPLRHDAYMPWARAMRFRDATPDSAGQRPWFWLLLELRPSRPGSTSPQSVVTFSALAKPFAAEWIRLPGHYAHPPLAMGPSRYCTALVSLGFLDMLEGAEVAAELLPLRDAIARYELGYAMAPETLDGAQATPRSGGKLKSGDVVMAVIDDGLGFANERFCKVDANNGVRTSRFLSLWIQDGQRDGSAPGLYGRCLSTAVLNKHLEAGRLDAGRYDEDAAYAAADYDVLAHRITHGTHVLDLACGADPHSTVPEPWIVGVQVRGDVLEDTSSASGTVFLLDAVWHVLTEADGAFGGTSVPAPVIINMSMGNIAGPHDGSSIFEKALDEMILARRKAGALCHVVLPSGNSYLSRCHAWIELGPKSAMDINWNIQPGDGTPSFVELWFSATNAGPIVPVDIGAIEVTVTPPNGRQAVKIGVGQSQKLAISGQTVAVFNLQRQVANGDLGMGVLGVGPTDALDATSVCAPPGPWEISIYNAGDLTISCNAYVQRDDIPFGRRGRGRQSYLDDPAYRRFDDQGRLEEADSDESYVRRVGTLNALATGMQVDRAEGVRGRPAGGAAAARYSSTGLPTVVDPGTGLRKTAITEDSAVLHGVLASGTRSGSMVSLSGTSMAAPQLARQLANDALVGGKVTVPRGVAMHGGTTTEYLPPFDELAERGLRRRPD